MNKEFTFFGKNIEFISLSYGIFLFFWGLIITQISGSQSFTSLIPSIFGFPILLFSYLSIKFPKNKKLFMHISITIGLLIFIGGIDFLRSVINFEKLFINFWADISKLMMFITGFIYIFLCIKSFIFARKNKN